MLYLSKDFNLKTVRIEANLLRKTQVKRKNMKKKKPWFFGFGRQSSKKDFEIDMLPHDRKGVFADVIKLHYSDLLMCGFLMLVACLPLIICSISKVFAVSSLTEAIASATDAEVEIILLRLAEVKDLYAFIMGVCFIPVFLFLAGFLRVILLYAWEENVYFKTDFFKGFKLNWLQMLLLSVIVGGLYSFSSVCWNMAEMESDFLSALPLMTPMCVFVIGVIPLVCYCISVITVYTNSFGNVLKIASSLLLAKPLVLISAAVASLAVFAVALIPSTGAVVAIYSGLAILSPAAFLGWMLFSLNLFDEYINSKQFPEMVGRGLVPLDSENKEEKSKK